MADFGRRVGDIFISAKRIFWIADIVRSLSKYDFSRICLLLTGRMLFAECSVRAELAGCMQVDVYRCRRAGNKLIYEVIDVKNIAVLVSGGGTNLQALIDAQRSGEIKNGVISLVISSKAGVYALRRAEDAGIKTLVLPRSEYETQAGFDNDLLAALKAHYIDLVVLAGFLTILGDSVIAEYRNRIINVHPSLIPAFCGKGFYGLKVHEAALSRGVKLTGATVHLVNEEPDGGPILLQRSVEVREDDTPEALQKRVMRECEHVLLPLAVSKFCEDKIRVDGNIAALLP